MRVLVTGAAGFIGSNLVARCLREGWDVVGVDDLSSGREELLPEAFRLDGSRFWRCDFAGRTPVDAIKANRFDVVVHLAARARVSYSVEHPLETNDVNVTRTLRLLDACRDHVGRFVFASSSSVYGGASRLPTMETAHHDPKSPYALQKSVIEGYLRLYRRLYGLDSVALRFFNVFGPGQLGDSSYATAIASWLTAIKQDRPMRSDGTGDQTRDLCYVDNVVDAIGRASTTVPRDLGDDRAFNVGCGDRTSNNELLRILLRRYPNARVDQAPERPGDVMHTQADVTKAHVLLGYEPIVRIKEGVDLTCMWYDQNWDWLQGLVNRR